MEKQTENAIKVADYLQKHPKVTRVYYLGLLKPEDGSQYDVFKRHCSGPGAMVSFDLVGGEKGCFEFLNNLKMIHLAVSLGSTESLVQHPYSMTHAGVPDEEKEMFGLTDSLIRLSVGVENIEDLLWDLEQALDMVKITNAPKNKPMAALVD
jgi:methionine-gamma-lyase